MSFTILDLKLAAISIDKIPETEVECIFYKMKVESEDEITEAVNILRIHRPNLHKKISEATKCFVNMN